MDVDLLVGLGFPPGKHPGVMVDQPRFGGCWNQLRQVRVV
jgi:hypothetical protein